MNKTNEQNEKVSLPFFGIGRVFPYLWKYRRAAIPMVLMGFVSSGIDIIIPLFQRYSLDHYVKLGTLDTLPYFIALYVFVICFAGVINYISCAQITAIEVKIDRDMRNDAFRHLQTLSFSYFNANSVGYIHSRVMSDTGRIGTLLSWTLMDAVWHGTYFFGTLIVGFSINAKLTLWILAIAPLTALLLSFFRAKLVKINREMRELNSKITSDFNEGITGAKTVKSLVIEDKMDKTFFSDTKNMNRKSVRSSVIGGMFGAAMDVASSVAIAIVLWRGGYIAESEVGTFSLFMSYAMGLIEPIRWLVNAISELIACQVNIERITRLLATESDVSDSREVIEKYGDIFEPKKENWEEIKGDITFEDVSFKYPDGDDYVLEHFNLDIPFGSNIAIVGETGAGKSTLVNLVCRFFEPTSGRILIDGKDARERSQLWLHSAIGYVLQTPHLFSGTIRENLLYGNPDATDEEIMQVLSLVSADDMINRLEKGLDTDVGEGGDLLSTGEKQLISFARAILSDPRILVLDEATASIDTITEQKIQGAIETVISGRTSLVIAHRLSTVKNADLILVVKDGKIIESGKHEELLRAKSYYYKLYTRQYEDEATSSLLGAGRPRRHLGNAPQ